MDIRISNRLDGLLMDPLDGRRARGAATRARVLQLAGDMASVKGLGGLTLASIGKELNVSRSNVHALFGGSKLELQLATVSAARARFISTVVEPVADKPRGLPRLRALLESWLDYIDDEVFTGGCFVLHGLSEYGHQEGPVRTALLEAWQEWLALLIYHLDQARANDEVQALNSDQAIFELNALLVAANAGRLGGDQDATNKARLAVEACLQRLTDAA